MPFIALLLVLLLVVTAKALRPGPLLNTYDYIIVGGGTCGLVVANRLSENLNITVLVIEAGDSVYTNPDVTDPDGYGRALDSAIDWRYNTVAQVHGNSDVQTIHAAKALGGTSTINGDIPNLV